MTVEGLKSFIASRIPKPLLQHPDGTVVVYQRFFEKIREGYGFYTSKRWEGVATGDSVDVYFENPANSGRDVYLVIIDIIGTNALHADFYHDNVVVTPSTTMPRYNLNFKSTITSVFYFEYGGSYTLGDLVHQVLIPRGPGARAVGGATEVGEAVIIPPDHNFVLRMTNAGATAQDIAMRAIWWEEEV